MGKICKKCGYERLPTDTTPEHECPKCGAVYAKVDAALNRKAEEEKRRQEEARQKEERRQEEERQKEKERQEFHQRKQIARSKKTKEDAAIQIKLNCNACGEENSMEATRVKRFSGIVRFIGYIIVTPSVIGVLFGGLVFIAAVIASSEVMSAEQTGATVGDAVTIGFSVFIAASSLVGGLIGWLLLMKKKVYKCTRCGYILDRD